MFDCAGLHGGKHSKPTLDATTTIRVLVGFLQPRGRASVLERLDVEELEVALALERVQTAAAPEDMG